MTIASILRPVVNSQKFATMPWLNQIHLKVDSNGTATLGAIGLGFELTYTLSEEEKRQLVPVDAVLGLDLKAFDLGCGKKNWTARLELLPSESPTGVIDAIRGYRVILTDEDDVELEIEPTVWGKDDLPPPINDEFEQIAVIDDPVGFAERLEWVSLAASSDEGRPHLNSLLIEPDGSCVATDGYRLHLDRSLGLLPPDTVPVPPANYKTKEDIESYQEKRIGRMLPLRFVDRVLAVIAAQKKDCPPIVWGWSPESVRVVIGDWSITTKINRDGVFQPWREIVSASSYERIVVAFSQEPKDLKKLDSVIEKARKLADMTCRLSIIVDRVSLGVTSGGRTSSVTLPTASVEKFGMSDIEILLNPAYLKDVAGMTMTVIPHNPPHPGDKKPAPSPNPIRFEAGSRTAIVMPQRFNA